MGFQASTFISGVGMQLGMAVTWSVLPRACSAQERLLHGCRGGCPVPGTPGSGPLAPLHHMCLVFTQAPVFLLFLDCVWQLVHQHPPAFEFTETYLTVLSDSLYIPIFSTFFFNSPHQKDMNMVRVTLRNLCIEEAVSNK